MKLLPLADGTTKILATTQPDHTTWPIANERAPLQFRVPLVADRELRGAGSAAGQCPNGPPCAPSEAGDYLQVKIDTSIGTPLVLTPVVALFSTAPPPPAAGTFTVRSSVRASAFAKGVSVRVQAAKGAKLAVAVTARSGKKVVTIAKGSATAKAAGQTAVKVRRTGAGTALLGKRTLRATVTLTATGAGLSTVTRTATLTVRR